jgi:hypothetical protein
MDKILNGVEALTSKSGLLNSFVGLAERFVPQTEAAADTKCPGKCFYNQKRQCGSNINIAFVGTARSSSLSQCLSGPYTQLRLDCRRRCNPNKV